MPPKVLYFDLGKVLVDFCHERMCRQMAEVAGTTPKTLWDVIFRNADCRTAQVQYETGCISTDEYFDFICQATGTSPDRQRLTHAACDIYSPIEPMWELARSLTAAGNRLALLSNTCAVHWNHVSDGRYPVVALGQPKCAFGWAILSFEVGAMKPDRTIYEAAIERAGVAAHDLFFADDLPENVEGARALGIDAVQFVDTDQLIAELQSREVPGA